MGGCVCVGVSGYEWVSECGGMRVSVSECCVWCGWVGMSGWVSDWVGGFVPQHTYGVRGKLPRVGSFLPLCGR